MNPVGDNGLNWYAPAKYNYNIFPGEGEVIGVIGSTMFDKLEKGQDHICFPTYTSVGAGYAFPVNYGLTYDLAAPTSAFFSTQGVGGVYRWGNSNQDCDEIGIVAGVAALLLELKPNQSAIDMKNRLNSGADKVGGYTYGGLLNKSTELASGRINCLKASQVAPTRISHVSESDLNATIANGSNCWILNLMIPSSLSLKYSVYTVEGKVIQKGNILKDSKTTTIDNTILSEGLYLITISDNTETITLKATK